jgi:hypothetical protein
MEVSDALHFEECYTKLTGSMRRAKRAFKAVMLHLKTKSPRGFLSSSDRKALKQLRVFWSGSPMRHTQKDLYAIKEFHVLNGRHKASVAPLWTAYIEEIMGARTMCVYMAERFPQLRA